MSKVQQKTARRATIKDVARDAGVSVTTVSNVLNGRTEAMTEETLRRIQETIRVLNYRPSSVARSLVSNSTATIGVIVAEIHTPLFLQALNTIEPLARSANYNILLSTARSYDDERQAVNLLLEKQVEGIIFLCTSAYQDDDYLLQLPSSAPPMALINRPTAQDRFNQIHLDNVGAIVEVIDYLAGLGHRRIAHLYGPASRRSSDERLRGYRLGLEKHILPYREDYIALGNYLEPPEASEQSTLNLLQLSPRPTAIIAADDIVAAAAMRTIQRAGLKIPQDITVIGIDDHPFCTYLNPTLTTIQLPIIEAGKQAVELLIAQMTGEYATPVQKTLSCPLIVRESSGPPPDSEK